MKKAVILSIRGCQRYEEQNADTIELVTEGTLEQVANGWEVCYEESDLTGLQGVTTAFRVEGKTITLVRTGKLNSTMVFEEGTVHDSLYQIEFGALMLTVCAKKVESNITPEGGVIDLVYSIEVEHSAAGIIEYHLDMKAK